MKRLANSVRHCLPANTDRPAAPSHRRRLVTALAALCLSSPATAPAHGDGAPAAAPLSLGLFADVRQSWREESPLAFAVPGFMPGGDIGPDARGLSLAHAGARLDVRSGAQRAALEINSHSHHGGDTTLQLEQAWFRQDSDAFAVSIGRQFAALGLRNDAHGPHAAFPDANLAYRVFLGDHYVDDGVALAWQASDAFHAGIAVWRGTFPAGGIGSEGNCAFSAHLDSRFPVGDAVRAQARLALLAAQAELRYDERFEPGHSHNPFVTAPALPYFSGDSTLAVASLQLVAGPVQWLGEGFFRQERGAVRNLTQQADYDGQQSAVASEILWSSPVQRRWRLGARYTALRADNTLTGPAAATLATQSGLVTAGNPEEISLLLDWRPDARQRVRLQWVEGGDYRAGDAVLLQYAWSWQVPLGTH